MKIIAFDSSLQRTGVAFYRDGAWFWEAKSFIVPRDKGFPDARFADWREWAASLIDYVQPDACVYEVPTTHGQGKGEAQIMLMMTLRELCAVRRIPTLAIYPAHLKKHLTGDGQADKAAMMRAVAARVPEYNPVDDDGGDIADALAMLLWHQDGAPPSQASRDKAARKARSTPARRVRAAKKVAKDWSAA